jgi:hypothetical protein
MSSYSRNLSRKIYGASRKRLLLAFEKQGQTTFSSFARSRYPLFPRKNRKNVVCPGFLCPGFLSRFSANPISAKLLADRVATLSELR